MAHSNGTLLSYLLQNVPRDRIPTDAASYSLHPFASTSPEDPLATLRNLVDASSALSRNLHSYSSLTTSDHKLVSILRQSTALIEGLHTSKQDAERRAKAFKSRSYNGAVATYGDPIPLDDDAIVEWCISRIEGWGRQNGMEVFKDEEDRAGKMTVMLGGKVLVIDVDLAIHRTAPDAPPHRISVTNIKTSHALPSGNSGNALAERSASLDAFMLRTWNNYLDEVQKNEADSSTHAAQISRDIQSHLAYLMKLDALTSQEGDQGIRWFSDTGLLSAVTERISRTEVDSLSAMLQSPTVHLDIFLSRGHALAIPYLVSPAMSFLVYLSPLAYYSLLSASKRSEASASASRTNNDDAFAKMDVSLTVVRDLLTERRMRPSGTIVATLMLTSVSSALNIDRRPEQRPNLGRPHFRLPGTSMLAALDHTFISPPVQPGKDLEHTLNGTRDVWMLDFTEGGQSSGIVMTHSRMREIQQVIDPLGANSGLGFTMHMQMPPLPGSWVGLLINPEFPPSERYIAAYNSPSNAHPPLRLRLTAPNEAGFLLQRIPVTSLKEVYGVLEIVRDQCWINETLKTMNWVAEDLMPETDDERNDEDIMSAPEDDLQALLEGTYTPRRIPLNVFLPIQPPSFSSANADAADGLDLDAEHAVPGLSLSVGGSTPPPCVAMAFAVHKPGSESRRREPYPSQGPRQVAIVLRYDRSRKRGVRLDVNVSVPLPDATSGFSDTGERPSAELMDELEESSRRGGAFGTAGKVWSWLAKSESEVR